MFSLAIGSKLCQTCKCLSVLRLTCRAKKVSLQGLLKKEGNYLQLSRLSRYDPGERGAQSMDFLNSKNVSLLTYYENIRQQVDADRHSQHRFTGGAVKQYAEKLRAEMDRRRLSYKPIDWS